MTTHLPTELEPQLTRWSRRLADTLGEALQSVILFGGLAKGEFVPGQSDVNVAVILRRADAGVLDRAAPLLQQGALEFRLSSMLMTEADLRDSADVFPIKFLDMQRHHRVLWGDNPFTALTVARANLVLRCQQELRNLSLRLRHSYVARSSRSELLEAALGRAVSSLLVNLGVVLELKNGTPVETKQAALEQAAQLGLPLEPVRRAWAVKQGELRLNSAEVRNLYAAFMDSVQQCANLAAELK